MNNSSYFPDTKRRILYGCYVEVINKIKIKFSGWTLVVNDVGSFSKDLSRDHPEVLLWSMKSAKNIKDSKTTNRVNDVYNKTNYLILVNVCSVYMNSPASILYFKTLTLNKRQFIGPFVLKLYTDIT